MVIDQEKAAAGATSVVSSLWICLTVIVWLLVPLFKPVKDADIDTQQIYKIHTLANWGQGATEAVTPVAGSAGAGGGSAAGAARVTGSADSATLAVPGGK